MNEPKGSADEAIGRPQEWRENRYQQPGKPIDQSVKNKPGNQDAPKDTVSTPVTRRDYQ